MNLIRTCEAEAGNQGNEMETRTIFPACSEGRCTDHCGRQTGWDVGHTGNNNDNKYPSLCAVVERSATSPGW
jgi:hypothetical protein